MNTAVKLTAAQWKAVAYLAELPKGEDGRPARFGHASSLASLVRRGLAREVTSRPGTYRLTLFRLTAAGRSAFLNKDAS